MVRFPCHTSKESLLHKTKSPNFPCFISSVQFKGSIQVKHHHVRQVLHIFLGRKQGIAPAELVWKSSLCLCQTDFSQLNEYWNVDNVAHQSTTSKHQKVRQTSALKIHQSHGHWLPWIQLEQLPRRAEKRRVTASPSSMSMFRAEATHHLAPKILITSHNCDPGGPSKSSKFVSA